MSYAALAQGCGMKRQQVCAILVGKTPNPGVKTLRKMARSLGLDLSVSLKP